MPSVYRKREGEREIEPLWMERGHSINCGNSSTDCTYTTRHNYYKVSIVKCHAFQTWIYWKSFLNLHEFVVFIQEFIQVRVREWVSDSFHTLCTKKNIMLGNWSRKAVYNITLWHIRFLFMGIIKAGYLRKKSWIFWEK